MDATPPEGPGPVERPARAFATGYRPHSGDMMVYGGGAMTLVGVLATVVNATPVFLIASLAGSLSALYFRPTLDTQRAQLGANAQGIYIARIGIIEWDRIADLRVEHHALRTMRLATLVVVPDGPLDEAVAKRETLPLAERFAARNARVKGGAIRVPLHTLAMPVDVMEERLVALRRYARRA